MHWQAPEAKWLTVASGFERHQPQSPNAHSWLNQLWGFDVWGVNSVG